MSSARVATSAGPLVVDVTDSSSSTLDLPHAVLRNYIGGAGLGTWLLTQLAHTGVDPLGPQAPWRSCSRRWSARR